MLIYLSIYLSNKSLLICLRGQTFFLGLFVASSPWNLSLVVSLWLDEGTGPCRTYKNVITGPWQCCHCFCLSVCLFVCYQLLLSAFVTHPGIHTDVNRANHPIIMPLPPLSVSVTTRSWRGGGQGGVVVEWVWSDLICGSLVCRSPICQNRVDIIYTELRPQSDSRTGTHTQHTHTTHMNTHTHNTHTTHMSTYTHTRTHSVMHTQTETQTQADRQTDSQSDRQTVCIQTIWPV